MASSRDEKIDYELATLRKEVDNLKLIIRELLRDRVHKEIVDGWVEEAPGWGLSNAGLEKRGPQIAAGIDQYPGGKTKWPPKT